MRFARFAVSFLPILLAAQPNRNLDPNATLHNLTLGLKISAEKQAELDKFLLDLHNPGSPQYHRWISPEEFGERFGATKDAVEALTKWLSAQGLQVDEVSRGRSWISFRGSHEKISRAFRFDIGTKGTPRLPDELEGLVSGYFGMQDIPERPAQNALPGSPDGFRAITPQDVAIVYNLDQLQRSGVDGAGVKIVITGISEPNDADIAAFRTRFGLPTIKLQKIFAGTAPASTSAAGILEANLDIQWAGALARNADIVYVYSSDSRTSLLNAVDKNLGHVVSHSFVTCEAQGIHLSQMLRTVAQQANAQGMTVVAAAGDAGAANCDARFEGTSTGNGPSVALPASVPEITAVGGTTLYPGSSPYWRPAPDFNGVSALGYTPETAWNDSVALKTVAAGGGGPSSVFPRPNWQIGPGMPAGDKRLTPDISFAAGLYSNGYVVRSGDAWRVAGGTSAATPVFAGMLAMLNRYLISRGQLAQPGLGNVNPAIYRMWQVTPAAIHDVTSGDNKVPCIAGTAGCVGGLLGYNAGAGYDLATGLGSLDGNVFITQWDGSQTVASATTLTVSNLTPTFNDNITLDVLVRSTGAYTPTGPISFFLASTTEPTSPSFNSATFLGTSNLVGGGSVTSTSLTIQAARLNVGANRIVAYYAGSPLLNSSGASAVVTMRLPSQNSAVQVIVEPREVGEESPNTEGFQWFYRLTLKELAGFLSTITNLTINGEDRSGQIRSLFGGNNTVPAFGSLSADLSFRGVTAPYELRISISGADSGTYRWTRDLVVPLQPRRQFTYVSPGGLTNGASFRNASAPGMLSSIFGGFLATRTDQATVLPLPYTLAGTRMTINGVAAPFYFASPGQINFQIPYETQPGPATLRLDVDFAGGQRETYFKTFTVVPVAPGIFAGANNTLVPFSSAARGGTIICFITGDGALEPALPNGQGPAPGTPIEALPKPKLPVKLTVGGVPATVLFVGVPPGLAGVTQINFTVAPGTPLGSQDVVVSVGDVASPPVKLNVTQ